MVLPPSYELPRVHVANIAINSTTLISCECTEFNINWLLSKLQLNAMPQTFTRSFTIHRLADAGLWVPAKHILPDLVSLLWLPYYYYRWWRWDGICFLFSVNMDCNWIWKNMFFKLRCACERVSFILPQCLSDQLKVRQKPHGVHLSFLRCAHKLSARDEGQVLMDAH